MIKEGIMVQGTNMKGSSIEGIVENVLDIFQIAIVRIGEDRLNVCTAYIKDIEEKK